MKITIDTDRGLFIVPNTFFAEIEKQNKYLKKAGVPEEKFNTAEKVIREAYEEAMNDAIDLTDDPNISEEESINEHNKSIDYLGELDTLISELDENETKHKIPK